MRAEGFEPRIVVPDDMDAETVFVALLEYQIAMAARYRVTGGVEMEALRAGKRAADLSLILAEQLETAAIRKFFGGMPDDLSEMGDENRS